MEQDCPITLGVVSRYQILRKIGCGGMGDVYEAEDMRLGRHVALKFLPERLADDPQAQERFELEARAASALNHPNICTIYEIDEADGKSFIAMELLDGETLRSRLWGGPLSLSVLLETAIQITSALDAAHGSGVVHRDIKPENIFLSKAGHVKVLDFGVAKMASECKPAAEVVGAQPTATLGSHLTAAGIVVGTTCYMSPEQIRGEELDARSDLFSFGAVLYEMSTGKRAFDGNTIGLMCDAVLNRHPEPVTSLNPQLPERLQEIIDKALEKEVALRYQSAADLRADLIRLKRTLDSDTKAHSSSGANISAHRRSKAQTLSNYIRWVLAAVSAVLLIAVAAYLVSRPHKPSAATSEPVKLMRLTANSVEKPVDGAAISPDGRFLAYSDKSGIHIKTLDGGETRTIPPPDGSPGAPNTWYPVAWFPSGSKLIAISVKGTQASAWAISLLGGSPQLLREGAWPQAISHDGSQIAFLVNMDYAGGHEVWAMGSQGENAHKLIEAPADSGFSSVSYSPDGNAIAYAVQQGISMARVQTLDLRTNQVSTIIEDPHVRSVFWIPDGRLIYSLQRAPASPDCDLWAVTIGKDYTAVGSPRQITNWPGSNFISFSATEDGKQLTFLRISFEADVYVGDFNFKSLTLGPLQRLTLDDHNDMPTSWAPDSKSVIFFSDREGPYNVYKQALGGDAEALTTGPGYKWGPRLSSDGTGVAYLESPDDPFTYAPLVYLKRVGLDGGPPQTILSGRNINDHRCSRGKNAICLFDELSEDGKRRTLYVYDEVHGRGREIISYDANPYSNWDLSPDGKVIAISRFDPKQARIRFISLQGQSRPDLVVKGWSAINSLDWTPDGKALLLSASTSRGSTLLLVDERGDAQPIWHQGGGGQVWGIPSPDGRRIALAGGQFDSNAWMLEKF